MTKIDLSEIERLENQIRSYAMYENVVSDPDLRFPFKLSLDGCEKIATALEALPKLVEALEKIIGFNTQQATDQYGNPEKAEKWACVKVAREALTLFETNKTVKQ